MDRDSASCELTSSPYVYNASTSGIDELETQFTIFPNPTSSSFLITVSNNIPFTAKIRTIDGKTVSEEKATEMINIESSDWKSGVYFIELYQGNKKTTQKLIKK